MSVEQTTQLIQLILNSVLMSVACALVLGGLTARHASISSQLQAAQRPDPPFQDSAEFTEIGLPSPHRFSRSQVHRLRYRYRITRYSVLSAYYALLFAIFSCFVLVLRGMIDWNFLIPLALGCFVIGVATLLVAVGLTLVDWHLSDRALLDETHTLLSLGQPNYAFMTHHRGLPSRAKGRSPHLNHKNRSKMRVG